MAASRGRSGTGCPRLPRRRGAPGRGWASRRRAGPSREAGRADGGGCRHGGVGGHPWRGAISSLLRASTPSTVAFTSDSAALSVAFTPAAEVGSACTACSVGAAQVPRSGAECGAHAVRMQRCTGSGSACMSSSPSSSSSAGAAELRMAAKGLTGPAATAPGSVAAAAPPCSARCVRMFSSSSLSTGLCRKMAPSVLFLRLKQRRTRPSHSTKLIGGGGLSGSRRTTDESTFGGGRKEFLDTFMMWSTWVWRGAGWGGAVGGWGGAGGVGRRRGRRRRSELGAGVTRAARAAAGVRAATGVRAAEGCPWGAWSTGPWRHQGPWRHRGPWRHPGVTCAGAGAPWRAAAR